MMSIPPKVRSPFVWSLTKRQVCSLALIFTLVCSCCVIAGYSYAASIGAQKYPTSYMEGGPTGAYHYMIYTFQNDTNTYYAAKNSFGDNIDSWTSTDLATVLQDALDSGSGRIKLNLLGAHTLSKKIVLQLGSQYIEGIADASIAARSTNLILAANVNDDMFLINGTTNHDYYGISRVWLDGNKANQGAGNWNGITALSTIHLELDHIQLQNANYCGFNLVGSQILEMQSCYAQGCGSRGLYMQGFDYKVVIKQCWFYNNPTNIYINNCEDVEFYGLKTYDSNLYDGLVLENCRRLKFYGLDAQLNHNNGIKFYGSDYCSVFGGVIKNNGQQTNNTYSGITFVSCGTNHCTNNMIQGIVSYSDVATVQKYGIYEADTNQTYNLISQVQTYGAGTVDILTNGAATSVSASYNGTTLIP